MKAADSKRKRNSQHLDDASSRLKQSKRAILDLWEKRTRESLPAAKRLTPPALIDTLPEMLDRLIEVLSRPDPKANLYSVEKELAKSHGVERAFFDDYTLDQVISEYYILRAVLFEVLEAKVSLTPDEREVITDALFISTRNAASEFSRVREAKQHAVHARLKESHVEIAHKLRENSTELAFSRELLNSIHMGVQDYAIFTLDPNGIITTWNQGAARMKEYSPEEAIGQHYSMLYPQEGRLRDEPMGHLRTAATEGRFRGEGLRVRKSGEHFLADVLITAMYRGDELFGFCKIVQDLSERSHLIQERDLTHTQVQTLQMENDLRERFVFTLTHDLRNPLSAARVSSEMIARQPCNSDRHRDLATRSIHSIQRADRMITDLLDVSRIKAGEALPISLSKCDLRRILDEVHDELSTIYGSRFLIDADETVVGPWDAENMKRVIENLAVNAIKYGASSTPVTLSLRKKDDRVYLKVHNYGPVIQSNEISSLFQPFRRAQAAETSTNKGWGLGLALVRGIAEAHGGMVKVESYPKEGTTFMVDLPGKTRPSMAKSA